jgi:hypothetical protein
LSRVGRAGQHPHQPFPRRHPERPASCKLISVRYFNVKPVSSPAWSALQQPRCEQDCLLIAIVERVERPHGPTAAQRGIVLEVQDLEIVMCAILDKSSASLTYAFRNLIVSSQHRSIQYRGPSATPEISTGSHTRPVIPDLDMYGIPLHSANPPFCISSPRS